MAAGGFGYGYNQQYDPYAYFPIQSGQQAPQRTGNRLGVLGTAAKVGGGIAGNPLAMFGISKGIDLLSSLFGGGNDDYEQALKEYGIDRNRLTGMMGKDVYNPYQFHAIGRRGIYDQARPLGRQLDMQFGLDTGQGKGALYSRLLGQDRALLSQYLEQNALEKMRRDLAIGQTLGQMSANRLGSYQ